jgi:hypothetical protein
MRHTEHFPVQFPSRQQPNKSPAIKRWLPLLCAVAAIGPACAWGDAIVISEYNHVTGDVPYGRGSYDLSSSNSGVTGNITFAPPLPGHAVSSADEFNLSVDSGGSMSGVPRSSASLQTVFSCFGFASPLEIKGNGLMIWEGPSPYNEDSHATASFILTDLSTSQIIDSQKFGETFDPYAAYPFNFNFDLTYMLQPGHAYELDASLTSFGEFGQSAWGSLQVIAPVPLPSAVGAGLSGLGFAALLTLARRKIRSLRQT